MTDSPAGNDGLSKTALTVTLEASTPPRQWMFAPGETVQIGRATDNDVRLDDKRVSRCHAAVVEKNGRWECISLSRAGVFIDGEAVPGVVVQQGMIVEFGRSGPHLKFELAEVSPNEQPLDVDDDEITVWISQLASGEEDAAGKLWNHYFQRVVRLARTRLSANARRVADEEDVAISVFDSLYSGISAGKYPELLSRDNLWRLLVVMTARKAIDYVHHEHRQKRGGGDVRGESVFLTPGDVESGSGFDRCEGDEPTPEFALMLAEEAERLLDQLGDEELQEIARWKLDGDSNDDIAERLNCTARTVQRRLQRIREIWSVEIDGIELDGAALD